MDSGAQWLGRGQLLSPTKRRSPDSAAWITRNKRTKQTTIIFTATWPNTFVNGDRVLIPETWGLREYKKQSMAICLYYQSTNRPLWEFFPVCIPTSGIVISAKRDFEIANLQIATCIDYRLGNDCSKLQSFWSWWNKRLILIVYPVNRKFHFKIIVQRQTLIRQAKV